MTEHKENQSCQKRLDRKLQATFPGKTVKKALSRQMKSAVRVPSFVLEFLLSQYCAKDEQVEQGMIVVKRLLESHYLSIDERQKELSVLRQKGRHIIIDQVCVHLDLRKNIYTAELASLGLKGVRIPDKYPETCSRLLSGGMWCLVKLRYEVPSARSELPVCIESLAPIQVPNVCLQDYQKVRSCFTKDEWIQMMLRSIGVEPERLTQRERWLMLLRMVPLCESNYNLCELGPRATGKSYIYKESSQFSILVSGGQTTVANLFYNMSTRRTGLVTMWDCVAFDEVADIQMKDRDGIQIMKDYMASGSFSRGRETIAGRASMVFVGNIDGEPGKEDDLFEPFPKAMATDTAFLDRFHAYLPGWEIPKLHAKHFTENCGLVTDYLAEILHALRAVSFADTIDRYFRLSEQLNQRDSIAVRKTVSGLIKLVYPDGVITKEELEEILQLALEMRQRVKYQLYKISGDEFKDYQLDYEPEG